MLKSLSLHLDGGESVLHVAESSPLLLDFV